MLKQLMNNYIECKRIETMREKERKYDVLRMEVQKYYKDIEINNKSVDIPYYLKTTAVLNEVIKTPADVDYFYNRWLKWKKRTA